MAEAEESIVTIGTNASPNTSTPTTPSNNRGHVTNPPYPVPVTPVPKILPPLVSPVATTTVLRIDLCTCQGRNPKSRILLGACLTFPILVALFGSILLLYPGGMTLYSTRMEPLEEVPRHPQLDTLDVEAIFVIEGEEPPDKERPFSEEEGEKIPRSYVFPASQEEEDRIRHHHDHPHSINPKILPEDLKNFIEHSSTDGLISHRFLHFDLKGAPPKLSFLKEVLKMAQESGLNGLLIEYEDTFPWSGPLVNMSLSSGGYTLSQVQELLSYAENDLGFEVIPLIQTFGHVEFILKQEEWAHLRETPDDPQSFCPSKPEVMTLIEEMLDQILQVHKKAHFVHIGCDEVFNLRMCSFCQETSESRDALFLGHVGAVAALVRSRRRIPIIWDDMLRSISEKLLVESSIGKLVEPMVWVYAEDIDRFVTYDTWDKYSRIFPTIWGAGAFKGAFGETLQIPIISRHVDNSETWNEVIIRESTRWGRGVGGLVLTGWQRYDHFATLAELLPAAIPSLVYTSLVISTPLGSPEVKNRVLLPISPSSYSRLTSNDSESEIPPRIKRSSDQIIGRAVPHPRSLMKKKDRLQGHFSGAVAGPGFSLTNPHRLQERDLLGEIAEKNRKITIKFLQILSCPQNNAQRVSPYDLSALMKEADPELSYAAKCNFPGVAFFRSLFRLRSLLQEVWELDAKIKHKRGWVREYNIRHNYTSPRRVDEILFPEVSRLRRNLGIAAKSIGNSLSPFLSSDTILEWIEQNIWDDWSILDGYERSGGQLKAVKYWGRRPIPSPLKMIGDLGLHIHNNGASRVEL